MTEVYGILDIAELTDVGLKRQRNEDSSKMVVPPSGIKEAALGAIFIVADGMGGLGGGDVASKAAIDEIVRTLYTNGNPNADPIDRLQTALESANIFVREQAIQVGLPRIGSTASGILLLPNSEAIIFNVGDCRVYRLRKGQMLRISRDQSVMERQIESGMISEEAARVARNSMVTAFLGQPIPIAPVFLRDKVQPGDVYLICCDGLWSLVETRELQRIIQSSPARSAVRKLIQLALKRGGNDNITAIMVRIGKPPLAISRLLPLLALLIVVLAVLGVLAGSATPASNSLAATTPTTLLTPGGTATDSQATTNSTAPNAIPPAVATETNTPTSSPIPSATPSMTATSSATASATQTATLTPSNTPTNTVTATPTATSTNTASATPTMTNTPTPTATPTSTFTPTTTLTPSNSPTVATPTPTATGTDTMTSTVTYTPSISPTATTSPTRTRTPTITRTPSRTRTPTITRTPTKTRTATRTRTPSRTPRPGIPAPFVASPTPPGLGGNPAGDD